MVGAWTEFFQLNLEKVDKQFKHVCARETIHMILIDIIYDVYN